ncbi:MAG: SGNH/GDSL hydrolase family protein [Myxococcales bacterium]|nr:SGNH/GDSL hydrolase family protein [Myxococcales bacterium]MCB9537595.1 SGNH/GDSL hydrolase family protein [Myxococcales bacterium]
MAEEQTPPEDPRGWREIATLVAVALAVVVAAELAVRRVVPDEPPIPEVADGVADLEAGNPELLILGSSHARSFYAVVDRLEPGRAVVVPAEGGTFQVFDWILQHRLSPLIEARTPAGAKVRDRLERLVLVTTYWDMCPAEYAHFEGNLPARSWTFDHYAADVLRDGMDPLNRNFVQARFKQIFGFSLLARERGELPTALREALQPPDRDARFEHRIAVRRDEIEGVEYDVCWDPAGRAAFDAIVDYTQAQGLELTVVLFPLLPATITPKAQATTLARYAEWVKQRAATEGFQVVDMTLGGPLERDDFELDCDHVTPAGNERFAEWALGGPLRILHAEGAR